MMGSDMDLKNIHIREAKKGDVDQVHRMQVQWAEEDITHGYIADSRENLSQEAWPILLGGGSRWQCGWTCIWLGTS